MSLAALRYLHRAVKCRYRDHRLELDALLSRLGRGDVAIDVGANKGAFLWPLSRRVGADGRVVAIEPQPALATYLRATMSSLRLANVEVVEAAAGNQDGSVVLYAPRTGTSPGASVVPGVHVPAEWHQVEVRAVRLDTLMANAPRRVGAIKVDVEGFEPQVLAGAETLLTTHRPVIVFECEERHLHAAHGVSSVRDVLSWLTARGYVVSFVQGRWLVGAEEYAPERHQRRLGDRYWDDPDYCNNFVAVPR